MAARKRKKLLASDINDFRVGIDTVVRRKNKAYVVDTQGAYADVEIQGDVMTPEVEANLRALDLEQARKMMQAIIYTPFLSEEGKVERLNVLFSRI